MPGTKLTPIPDDYKGHYSREKRLEAATLYAIEGSQRAVSRKTGIPIATVNDWANSGSEWWDGTVERIRTETDQKLIANYSKLAVQATDKALDRLDECTPKELVVMAAVSSDKRQLLLQRPTSYRGASGEGLEALAQRFAQLVRQSDPKVIEGETVQSGAKQAEDVG